MSKHGPYVYSSACGWGLTLSGAAFGVSGILALFISSPMLSVLCVFALASMTAFAVACANFAAAAAMHAASGIDGRIHWPTFWPAVAVTLVFAFGSAGGVHLGWLVLADMAPNPEKLPDVHVVDLAALILCVAKPAMTWIVEGRKAIDKIAANDAAARAAEEVARREREERARQEQAAIERRKEREARLVVAPKLAEPPKRPPSRIAAAGAAVALAMGAGAVPAHAESAPVTTTTAPPKAPAKPAVKPRIATDPAAVAEAERRIIEGVAAGTMSLKGAARQFAPLGITYHRVRLITGHLDPRRAAA